MDAAEKAFHETATTWGLAVGVLIVLAVALIWILWKLGQRLITSHERFLDLQIELHQRSAAELSQIKERLPNICQAACPTEEPQPHPRKRLA